MNKQLLECGHYEAVVPGAGVSWCPICNEMALVIDETRPPEPVRAGTAVALMVATR
ncbi:hypothetical protein ACSMXN_08150 [Jatrophihabitans sp. DSM 45814]